MRYKVGDVVLCRRYDRVLASWPLEHHKGTVLVADETTRIPLYYVEFDFGKDWVLESMIKR